MTTKIFDRVFYNENNFKIIEEQNQICKNCNDIKIYHPLNLCYNYEPKFNQVKKEILIEKNWSNYFKSYFTTLKPTVEITSIPAYSKYCVTPCDSGKAYCSSDLSNYIGGISPNFPFKKSNLPDTGCCNTSPSPPTLPIVNWLSLSLDKLEYIMNGMWIDMSNYIYKNIKVFLTPIKYITENDILQVNIQMKNQNDEIKQMKNTIENMKTQMLSDLKHKIEYEFIKLDKSNNCKVLIDKNIQEIKDKLENTVINIDEINLIHHKQKTKLLMEDINRFNKEKLNKNQEMLDDTFLKSISNIKKLKIQDIIDLDYEKIEA